MGKVEEGLAGGGVDPRHAGCHGEVKGGPGKKETRVGRQPRDCRGRVVLLWELEQGPDEGFL